MKASTPSFRGMAPRLTPRALPENGSQRAINARLLTGDLQPWKRPLFVHALANGSTVRSIFLLNDVWLSWTEHVDAARGTILGDTTFRTFLTGPEVYGEPRFTNYALATSGPEPYPFATRPLGVPGPDAAPATVVAIDTSVAPSVNVSDAGDQLDTWTTSGTVVSGGVQSSVQEDAVFGNPLPSYRIDSNRTNQAPAFAYKAFGIADAGAVTFESDFSITKTVFGDYTLFWRTGCTSGGDGLMVGVRGNSGGGVLTIGSAATWGASSAGTSSASFNFSGAAFPATGGPWYRMSIAITTNSDGTKKVTATVSLASVVQVTLTADLALQIADYCGFSVNTPVDDNMVLFWDNFVVQATAFQLPGSIVLATSYVYTFVNDLGQESAPSQASVTIQRADGVMVTVTTPTVIPTGISDDYGIVSKRIYRSVTGALGSVFRFVAEVPLATADYVDVLTDSQLGEVLESTDWDLPPDDLRFILALPNGIMVGASGNQLCLSARNRPHAWPVAYRLPTDTEITGLGNVDTSVVIGTKSFVYTASGNEPENYSMSKPGAPHACASHRSIAYLLRIGVVFAGPDGLMAVNGPTDVVNLTETIFTREQWQALQPETIIGNAHDDIYFFSYGDATGPRGMYALDMKPNGFGLIELGMHASAMAADLERDALVLCLDQYEEPSSALLPIQTGTEPIADGTVLYEWNADTDDMRYAWTGKLWLAPYPAAYQWVRVRAEDYTEVEIEFSTPAGVLLTRLVTSDEAFRIPVRSAYNEISWRALGTSRVRTVELADDVMELA